MYRWLRRSHRPLGVSLSRSPMHYSRVVGARRIEKLPTVRRVAPVIASGNGKTTTATFDGRWSAAAAAACVMSSVMLRSGVEHQQSLATEADAIPAGAKDVHGRTTKKWYFFKGRPEAEGQEGVANLLIFGGSVYPELSEDVCSLLGMKSGKIDLGTYADGECSVLIKESVMGKDVFVVSPTHTNDSLVELLLIIGAARRDRSFSSCVLEWAVMNKYSITYSRESENVFSTYNGCCIDYLGPPSKMEGTHGAAGFLKASADRITAVIPFYGYSRQDRRFRREPIAAADVAHMLEAMGVDRIITVDLHSGQIQGFFSPTTPVDHLTPMGVAAAYLAEMVNEDLNVTQGGVIAGGTSGIVGGADEPPSRIVVVAPQEGQVGRANVFKSRLEGFLETMPVGLAFIARSSTKKSDEEEEVHKHCIGDVRGALCIIVDDLVDTGGTLDNAVRLLTQAGARKIIAFATHGRFSGGGEGRVAEIPGLERLVICNTLPHRTPMGKIKDRSSSDRIRELSVAPLLAEAIYRVHKSMPFAELLTWTVPTVKGLAPRQMTRANLHDPSFEKEVAPDSPAADAPAETDPE